MTYAALLVFYVVSGYAWLRRTGSVLHPAVVHAVSWALPISWHWVYRDELAPLSAAIGILLVAASLAFYVPLLPRERNTPRSSPYVAPSASSRGLAVTTAIFMLPLISLFLALRVTGSVQAFSLTLLRESLVEDAPPTIGLGLIFPIVVGAFFYVRRPKTSTALRAVAWISALLLAILSTSKIFLFIVIFVAFAPSMEKATGALARRVLLIGLLGVAVFVLLHLALGKFIGADTVATPTEMIEAALLTLAVYFGGSISALEQEMAFRTQLPDGYLYLGLPGSGQDAASKVLPFTFVNDIGTNVYTGYAPVLHEFGVLGVLGFMFTLGLLYRFLYGRRHSPGGQFFYSFALFPLFFLFHNEFFVMALNLWIGFAVVASVLTRALAKEALA